jgi:hypothetical protein
MDRMDASTNTKASNLPARLGPILLILFILSSVWEGYRGDRGMKYSSDAHPPCNYTQSRSVPSSPLFFLP